MKLDDVELARGVTVDVESAYAWIRGERSLTPEDSEAAAFYRWQSPERAFARPASLEDLRRLGITVRLEPPDNKED